MLEVRNMRRDDPTVYLQLAGFYNRSGDFDQTIEALRERARIEPDNPEGLLHHLDVLLGEGVP